MEYKLSAIVEKEGKFYVSHCAELQISSQGDTLEDSLESLKEAVHLYLKHADPEEIEQLKKLHKEAPMITSISVS
ncbi:MAG: type II toxin-antitoxin system HicB family antitoxin [Candidatus Micrarchaeota archaeon]|nr:type II toxin-antitoxin system HicB family antitoxin [Candidatus Micrarchaeota archaeon]